MARTTRKTGEVYLWMTLAALGSVAAACDSRERVIGVDPIYDRGVFDMAPDGSAVPDGGPPDAAAVDGPDDMAVDAAPDSVADAAPDVMPAVERHPSAGRAAALERAEGVAFAYVAADGWLSVVELDRRMAVVQPPTGVFEWPFDEPTSPARFSALRAGAADWLMLDDDDAPVVLVPLAAPAEQIRLDDIHGPALSVPFDGGAMIVGRSPEGRLAWQIIGADGRLRPAVIDAFDRGRPDDGVETETGAVLLFAADQQCLHIERDDGRTARSFVCPGGPGALTAADGHGVRLEYDDAGGLSARALYVLDDAHTVVEHPVEPALRGRFSGARLFVGQREDGTTLSLVRPGSTASSGVVGQALLDDARAWFAARLTPALGVCRDGESCADATDCADGPCAEQPLAETLIGFTLDANDAPLLLVHPLDAQPWPVEQGSPVDCTPRPEVCDGVDQDCDGVPDDGRCCPADEEFSWRWRPERPIAYLDGRAEVLISDPRSNGPIGMMYRLEGTTRWRGLTFNSRRPDAEPGWIGVSFDDAVDGRHLLRARGTVALVARHGPDEAWSIFMQHPTRPVDEAPTPRIALGCERVLAAGVLGDGDVPGELQASQFVVICADRIVWISADPGAQPATIPFEALGLSDIDWATLMFSRLDRVELLVGQRPPDGAGWTLHAFRLLGRGPMLVEPGALVGVLRRLGAETPNGPVYAPFAPGRPPSQIIEGQQARVALSAPDAPGLPPDWRDVLFDPLVDDVRFSAGAGRIYGAGPLAVGGAADMKGWWVADMIGNSGTYDLWSTEPVAVAPASARWRLLQDARGLPWGWEGAPADLVIVHPVDDSADWQLRMAGARCLEPARP